MRRLASKLFFLRALSSIGVAGCHPGQDIAPTCFSTNASGECIEPASGLALTVDCSALPRAVATANYEYIVPHVPLPVGHLSAWQATGLPKGLKLDQGGVIRGRPQKQGRYTNISVTLRDLTSERSVTARCQALEVFAPLKIDLSKTKMGCISPDDNLTTLVSGGTGEALFCKVPTLPNAGAGCPHGIGNGAMPAGLSVNKDCSIAGNIASSNPHNGTFVWIVELQQSGTQRFVPFCATHSNRPDHKVQLIKSGEVIDYRVPHRVEFDPESSIQIGSHENPRIRVTSECLNQSCNRRGVSVAGTCSPLDYSVTRMLSRVEEILRNNRQIVGLTHGFNLHSGGQKLKDLGLGERPWVMSLNSRYCTSAQVGDRPACDVAGALESNITWSVIAWPRSK